MVYDCFPFFNELDILEIRLHELHEVVDRFVLVEATQTFQKQPKPLYFGDNQSRFAPFLDKITHVVVRDFPGFFTKLRTPTAWDYSNFQKKQVARGLKNAQSGDTVIVSDLDEIPRGVCVRQYQRQPGTKVFQQRLFNYFLNCVAVEAPDQTHLIKYRDYIYWKGSVMVDFRDFTDFLRVRRQRDGRGKHLVQIEEGGWHFSFLGGWEKVADKLNAWEHAREAAYSPHHLRDPARIKALVEGGEDLFGREFRYQFVALDQSYPAFVLRHPERFAKLIR